MIESDFITLIYLTKFYLITFVIGNIKKYILNICYNFLG
jgi:hypothetical protein